MGSTRPRGRLWGYRFRHPDGGDIYIIKAKATILAAGGIKGLPYVKPGPGQPISSCPMPNNLTGDGFAIAFRAGAELMSMELVLANCGAHMRDFYCAPSMNLFFSLGAKLTNRLGERFMEKYDPVRKEVAHRWVTGVAIAKIFCKILFEGLCEN